RRRMRAIIEAVDGDEIHVALPDAKETHVIAFNNIRSAKLAIGMASPEIRKQPGKKKTAKK
ncbi:MAG: hypothetical protein ACK5XN_29015, partial [Bacteroidota bacterium]